MLKLSNSQADITDRDSIWDRGYRQMTTTVMTKDAWVNEYAHRILTLWQQWKGPLGGADGAYIEKLKEDLDEQFDDPLKRSLIESTY